MKRKSESEHADVNRPAPATRTSAQDAVSKIWGTAEVVIQILSHLVQERIDLLTVSTVSKHFRTLALRLLVRDLDVPLTRAPSIVRYFEAHPEMASSIHHLRIRDDGAECGLWFQKYAYNTIDIPVYDSEQERDKRWLQVGRLFKVLLTHRHNQSLPPIDLTIGITSISAFKSMQGYDKVARKIVALRVITNLGRGPDEEDEPDRWRQFVQLSTTRWRQLADMLDTEGQKPALRLFHADAGVDISRQNRYIDREAWDSLKRVLPATVEELALDLNSEDDDPDRTCSLFEAEAWPRLRTFSLGIDDTDGDWGFREFTRSRELVDQFLSRHSHLEDIQVRYDLDYPVGPVTQTFPNLKKCKIGMSDRAHLAPFLARHYATVTELEILPFDFTQEDATLFPPEVDATLTSNFFKLDVLRASPEVSAAYVSRGAKPRHYQLEGSKTIGELQLDKWLFPVREAAEAVTCLDVGVSNPEVVRGEDLLRGKFLPAGALPNLVEMVLAWLESGVKLGTGIVCEVIATLKHQGALRALRLEHAHAPHLPNNTVLDLRGDDAIPPQLEYLTWHSASDNVTQYFRIRRIRVVRSELLSDGSEGTDKTAAIAYNSSAVVENLVKMPAPTGQGIIRVQRISEIMTLILRNLQRDKVDLLNASRVSKTFRAVAMPLLLVEMDIQLSNIQAVIDSFTDRKSRRLLKYVKYIRLWDDEVHQMFRYEPHSRPLQPLLTWRDEKDIEFDDHKELEKYDPRWKTQVATLLDMITMVRHQDLPLLDLSLGVIGAYAVNAALKQVPEFAERVAAIRITSDFFKKTAVNDWRIWNTNQRMWWKALVTLLKTIIAAQTAAAKSTVMKLFAIESFDHYSHMTRCISESVWTEITELLSSRIEHLVLQFCVKDADCDAHRIVLGAHWPRLRSLHLQLLPGGIDIISGQRYLSRMVENFLTRHPRIQALRISAVPSMPASTLSQSFVNLKRAEFSKVTVSHIEAFLRQHPEIADISIQALDRQVAKVHLFHQPISQLRTLRGSSLGVYMFGEALERISFLDFSRIKDLRDIILLKSAPLPRVTCINAHIEREEIGDVIAQLGHCFQPSHFPNLAELVLCCASDEHPIDSDSISSAKRLRLILLGLALSTTLRALHVEYYGGAELPTDKVLAVHMTQFPPALEYLAWHAPITNKTQYYRILRMRGTPKLQSLPSSRLRVDAKTGLWNQFGGIADGKIILDHSFFPPRLLA
ncbi:hypothetical protein CF319_g7402 [Tilletia indica]|nr:hypothetical protein CF319_g7402 [Tilletia indica]